MKLGHVIYKSYNLGISVQEFREKGFDVEYNPKINPRNALIYFSEGPYIEILEKAPISAYKKIILRLIGKGKVVDRLESWRAEKEGFFGICFENYEAHFRKEVQILRKYKKAYFLTRSRRKDALNRTLRWRILFPYELKLPFLMNYFNIDPKPENFIHPNGIKKIRRVCFGTEENLIPIIEELCNDEVLELFVGSGVKEVCFEKE